MQLNLGGVATQIAYSLTSKIDGFAVYDVTFSSEGFSQLNVVDRAKNLAAFTSFGTNSDETRSRFPRT